MPTETRSTERQESTAMSTSYRLARSDKQRDRSTAEVFEDHLRKREDESSFEEDLKLNFAEEVVLLTCTGICRASRASRISQGPGKLASCRQCHIHQQIN